jgi:LPS sulfotransferase NodH
MSSVNNNHQVTSSESKKVSKFVIFTTQRSGSTWLMDTLDNHPNIKVYNELFLNMDNKSKWADPNQPIFCNYQKTASGSRPWKTIKYLKNLYTYDGKYDVIGFKLMYDHLFRKPEILVNLVSEGYKIVHLVRENSIDVMLSYAIARENKRFFTEQEVENKKIYLNPEEFKKQVKKQDFKVNLANLLLQVLPNNVLNIYYDELRENRAETLTTITQFLSVPNVDKQENITSTLKKINQKSPAEVIENYSEIKAIFTGTKFAKYLN